MTLVQTNILTALVTLAAIVLVFVCIMVIGGALRERSWAKERRELYSRLQAGTLTDYVTNAKRLEKSKPKVKPAPVDGEVEPVVLPDVMPESYAEAQEAARGLMGE